MHIRILAARDVRTALPMRTAIEAMREAFGALASGEAQVPLRTAITMHHQDAVALFMPGLLSGGRALGAKLVSVFPTNRQRDLPLVHAAVILMDPETGQPLALIEGTALTAIRTGAASGLATDLLARANAASLAILGSGAQARTQLEAVCCVRDIREVSVYSPTRSHAERFTIEMAGRERIPAAMSVTNSPRDAASRADIICAATSSHAPVLDAEDIQPGTHVNGVGSYTPAMQEIDPELIKRARIVVDHREAALAEAGEVIACLNQGSVRERDLVELGEIVNGTEPGRTSEDQITVFKSVGVAVQDLSGARWAVEQAERDGLGVVVELGG